MKRIDGAQPIEAGVGSVAGETIEGLVRKSMGLPVVGQFSKVMIEATILLRHENNVIDGGIQLPIARWRIVIRVTRRSASPATSQAAEHQAEQHNGDPPSILDPM